MIPVAGGRTKRKPGKRERVVRQAERALAGQEVRRPTRRSEMGIKVDLKQELRDIWDEEYKFSIPQDGGQPPFVADTVPEILKLFLRNLNQFHMRANNGKAMPWEWSENCLAIATEMRQTANGVLELDINNHKWLMERVREYGTTFMNVNAPMLEEWLTPMKDSMGGEDSGDE